MFPPEPSTSRKLKPKPLVFGKEAKPSYLSRILAWGFILIAIAGIILMVIENPKEKTLVCQNAVGLSHSLTSFGGCTTE